MLESRSRYIPALHFRWLTPLYDPLLKWGMREQHFKQRLVQRAAVRPGQNVLDLGCGTGTLTLMLKRAVPAAHVTGVDGDRQVLAIASSKSNRAQLKIAWDYGLAGELPYADNSLDVVLSSLVIHHLATQDKRAAFREVLRVLRSAGQFHFVDFGPPTGLLTRMQAAVMANLEQAADNFRGRLLALLEAAGFTDVQQTDPMPTVFGPVWFYHAVKPKGL